MSPSRVKIGNTSHQFSLKDTFAVQNWLSKLHFPSDNDHPQVLRTVFGTVIGPLPIQSINPSNSAGLLDSLVIVKETQESSENGPQGFPASSSKTIQPQGNCPSSSLPAAAASLSNTKEPSQDPPFSSTADANAGPYDFRRFLPKDYSTFVNDVQPTSLPSLPPPPPSSTPSHRLTDHPNINTPSSSERENPPGPTTTLLITTLPSTPLHLIDARATSAPPSFPTSFSHHPDPKSAPPSEQQRMKTPPTQIQPQRNGNGNGNGRPPFLPPRSPEPLEVLTAPLSIALSAPHPLCPLELAAWEGAIRSLDECEHERSDGGSYGDEGGNGVADGHGQGRGRGRGHDDWVDEGVGGWVEIKRRQKRARERKRAGEERRKLRREWEGMLEDEIEVRARGRGRGRGVE